jgi:hypothetical protein
MSSGFTTARDLLVFTLGVGIIVYEVAVGHDVGMAILGGSMVGLPAFLPSKGPEGKA